MSLKWLLSLVGFFAISSVAVANPSAPWMAASVSSAVALLMAATVVASVSRPQQKFELGFALGGWIYLGLLLLGMEHTLVTTWASQRGFEMATGVSVSEEYYTGVFSRNPDSHVIFVSNKERRRAMGTAGGNDPSGAEMSGMDDDGNGEILGGGLGGGYGAGYGGVYGGGYPGGYGGAFLVGVDRPETPPFARYMHVSHGMWAVGIACCCGVVAARRRDRSGSS